MVSFSTPILAGADGFLLAAGRLGGAQQAQLVAAVLAGAERAPFYTPLMPRSGAPMSVRQTNFGPLGWVTDQAKGYRYEPRHPQTGAAWPPIPALLLSLWDDLAGWAPPEACLVNFYQGAAKMGLHIDADEAAADAPVVSVSLGDTAVFRLGGPTRKHPTRTMMLRSGDVVVLGGASRRFYHGVDRVLAGSSALIPGGGRINLTLRRVTTPSANAPGGGARSPTP